MLLHDFFEYAARARGHLPFAEIDGTVTTYDDASARVDRMAAATQRAGLVAGDRLAYIGANSVDHALVYFALSKCGIVTVPVNPRLAPDEVAFIIHDSTARAVIADPLEAERLAPLRDRCPDVTTWVSDIDKWLAGPTAAPKVHRGVADDVVYQMY